MSSRRPVRETVRTVVLTPAHQVLLLRYELKRAGGVRWLTPGGRRNPGESPEDCACRELQEETGLREFELGPLVWRRRYKARRVQNHEQFFLVRVAEFEPSAKRMGKRERSVFAGFQWWSVEEVENADARFEPPRLGHFLRALVTDGPPGRPLDLAG